MLLVTADDVRAVYETDRDDIAIQPFLDAAVAFVDDRLKGKGLSTGILKELQRYMAAHLMFVTDAGVHDSLRVEDVSERFTRNPFQPGLLDSRWGRTAVSLDSSGTFAALTRAEPPAQLRIIHRDTEPVTV